MNTRLAIFGAEPTHPSAPARWLPVVCVVALLLRTTPVMIPLVSPLWPSLLLVLTCLLLTARGAAPPPPAAPGWVTRTLDVLLHPALLLGLLGVLFIKAALLDIPSLLNDEGIWHYVGQSWVWHGAAPYVGALENKPPGIFYLYALSALWFGVQAWFVRVLGMLAWLITALSLYGIGRRLADQRTGILLLVLFGISNMHHELDGYLPGQVETFVVCFIALAAGILLTGTLTRRRLVVVGLCCGLALFFKQSALFSLAGLFGLYLTRLPVAQRTAMRVLQDVGLIAGTVLATTLLLLIPLFLAHVRLADYFEGTWRILLAPGSAAPHTLWWRDATEALTMAPLRLTLLVLPIIALCAWRPLRARQLPVAGLVWWWVCELVPVLLAGTFWGHQLKQPALPALLLGGLALGALLPSAQTAASRALVWVVALVFILWWPWLPPPRLLALQGVAAQSRDIGRWLHDHSTAQDSVYLCGTGYDNPILPYTERLAASRHFLQYFLLMPGATAQWRGQLAAHPPRYLLVNAARKMGSLNDIPVPAWLLAQLHRQYRPCRRFQIICPDETATSRPGFPGPPRVLYTLLCYERMPAPVQGVR